MGTSENRFEKRKCGSCVDEVFGAVGAFSLKWVFRGSKITHITGTGSCFPCVKREERELCCDPAILQVR